MTILDGPLIPSSPRPGAPCVGEERPRYRCPKSKTNTPTNTILSTLQAPHRGERDDRQCAMPHAVHRLFGGGRLGSESRAFILFDFIAIPRHLPHTDQLDAETRQRQWSHIFSPSILSSSVGTLPIYPPLHPNGILRPAPRLPLFSLVPFRRPVHQSFASDTLIIFPTRRPVGPPNPHSHLFSNLLHFWAFGEIIFCYIQYFLLRPRSSGSISDATTTLRVFRSSKATTNPVYILPKQPSRNALYAREDLCIFDEPRERKRC